MEVEVGQTYEVIEDESRGNFPLRKGEIVTVILTNAKDKYSGYCIVESDRDIVTDGSYNTTYRSSKVLNKNRRRVWIGKNCLKLHIVLDPKLLGNYPNVVRKIHIMEHRHKAFLTKKYSTGF